MQQSVVSDGAGGAAVSLMYPVNLSAAKEEELEECLEELLRREAFLFRSTFDSRIFPLTEPTWIFFSRISRTRYFFISYSRESPPLLLLAISSISRDSCPPPSSPLLLLLFKYFWFEILKIKVGAKKMAANLSRERMRGSIREERKILVPQQTLIRGEECAFFIRGEGEGFPSL